jgi:hypothetical protein
VRLGPTATLAELPPVDPQYAGSMVRAFLRAALFGGVFLALWTLAHPAAAANAPLCDDRGASAVADPPPLEAPEVAIERARATCAYTLGGLPFGARISPAHRNLPRFSPAPAPALPAAVLQVAPAAAEEPLRAVLAARPCDGVRSRVERPPRG